MGIQWESKMGIHMGIEFLVWNGMIYEFLKVHFGLATAEPQGEKPMVAQEVVPWILSHCWCPLPRRESAILLAAKPLERKLYQAAEVEPSGRPRPPR